MATGLNHATHHALLRDLAAREECIGRLADRVRLAEAKLELLRLVLRVWWQTVRIVRLLNRVERAGCIGCAHRCGFTVQQQLHTMARNLRTISEDERFQLLPAVLRRIWLDACGRLEDKLETYWIASDDQILDLAAAVAEKMKRRHAGGGV